MDGYNQIKGGKSEHPESGQNSGSQNPRNINKGTDDPNTAGLNGKNEPTSSDDNGTNERRNKWIDTAATSNAVIVLALHRVSKLL